MSTHQPITMSFWVKAPTISSLMKRPGFRRSQMLLSTRSSICWNNGTCTIDRNNFARNETNPNPFLLLMKYVILYWSEGKEIHVTWRTRSRQRWRFMSRRRPSGRSCTVASSSIPRVAAHFWRLYLHTRCRSRTGNCRLRIHHSRSRIRNCDCSFFEVIEWRNT